MHTVYRRLIHDRYHRRWMERSRRRAWTDPRWAEIETLRQAASADSPDGTIALTSEEHGLTLDMWLEQTRIERELTPHTIVHKIGWWMSDHPLVADPVKELRRLAARAKNGWAPSDVWNLNYFLAQLIVGTVSYLRTHSHGHPIGQTPESWDGVLGGIVDGFQAYIDAERAGKDLEGERLDQYTHAWELLAAWHPNLWD